MTGQGHEIACCGPDTCSWCDRPIEPGQGFARRTTTIFDRDHGELFEYWSDYHHSPAIYEGLQRRSPQLLELGHREIEGLGGCLFLSEHD